MWEAERNMNNVSNALGLNRLPLIFTAMGIYKKLLELQKAVWDW